MGEAEGVGVAEEHGAAQGERGAEVREQGVDVRVELVGTLPAEGDVAVQAAEGAGVPGAALGDPHDERQVLVGGQDADGPARGEEAGGVLAQRGGVEGGDRGGAGARPPRALAANWPHRARPRSSRRRAWRSIGAPGSDVARIAVAVPGHRRHRTPCGGRAGILEGGECRLGVPAGGLDDRLALRRREAPAQARGLGPSPRASTAAGRRGPVGRCPSRGRARTGGRPGPRTRRGRRRSRGRSRPRRGAAWPAGRRRAGSAGAAPRRAAYPARGAPFGGLLGTQGLDGVERGRPPRGGDAGDEPGEHARREAGDHEPHRRLDRQAGHEETQRRAASRGRGRSRRCRRGWRAPPPRRGRGPAPGRGWRRAPGRGRSRSSARRPRSTSWSGSRWLPRGARCRRWRPPPW